jgi:hypothetical protein
MKRLLLFTAALPLFLHAMEPEEKVSPEPMIKEYVAAYASGGYRWVKLVDEQLGLEGNFQNLSAPLWRTSEILAQEILRRKPAIKEFIRSQLPAPPKELHGHNNGILSAQFSADGARLATGSKDGTAKIWDVRTGQVLQTLPANNWVTTVAFSSAGDVVMTLEVTQLLTLWKWSTAESMYTLEEIIMASFNPIGTTLLTLSRDGNAYLTTTDTGTLLATLTIRQDSITSARCNQSGDRIATGSLDGSAQLWDEHGHLLGSFNHGSSEKVGILGFNASGTMLVTTMVNECFIWDVAKRELLYKLPILSFQILLNLGPQKLLMGDVAGSIQIFDIKTGTQYLTLKGTCGALSPTGDSIIDDRARLYTETGELITRYPLIESREFNSVGLIPVYNNAGDKVLMAFGATGYLAELAPLLLVEKFFKENITLQQVALLNDLFEVAKARQFGKSLDKQLEGERNLLIHKTFDFKRYPGLWADYQALPELIRNIFDPYVLAP